MNLRSYSENGSESKQKRQKYGKEVVHCGQTYYMATVGGSSVLYVEATVYCIKSNCEINNLLETGCLLLEIEGAVHLPVGEE